MELTADNVSTIFYDCLFKEGENTSEYIGAEGIRIKTGFHPERLKSHENNIISLLSQLPKEFMSSSPSGGTSFLNACLTDKGVHWGEHQNMEQLFLLGLACRFVKCLMPRAHWQMLPGGMPYYTIKIPQENSSPV